MFSDDDLLPISGLQHLAFCERQWALIHLEGQWAENRLTAEGKVLHERVEGGDRESRSDVVITRSIQLRCLRLGLVGKADVVEWRCVEPKAGVDVAGVPLPGKVGHWKPFPIEYKRGKPKTSRIDEVQLCAQALCLEEMLEIRIQQGALYYGKPRKRTDVAIDEGLREKTKSLAERMHELFKAGKTPKARYDSKCKNCSLLDRCLPKVTGTGKVARYLDKEVFTPESGWRHAATSEHTLRD